MFAIIPPRSKQATDFPTKGENLFHPTLLVVGFLFPRLDINFRSLLTTLNPSIEAHLVKADAFKDSIEKEWIRSSAIVKQLLATALSRIHISFDLWTSPNGMTILGVAAHFVNIHCQNQSVQIGMKRMEYSHTGEDIAEQLIPLLQEYGVVSTLGVFISDNVDVNDIAIQATLRTIRPDIDNIKGRRSRCLGHIINLAAQALIFGTDIDAFEATQAQDRHRALVDSLRSHSGNHRISASAALSWVHSSHVYSTILAPRTPPSCSIA
jgi:hypothetical protein